MLITWDMVKLYFQIMALFGIFSAVFIVGSDCLERHSEGLKPMPSIKVIVYILFIAPIISALYPLLSHLMIWLKLTLAWREVKKNAGH